MQMQAHLPCRLNFSNFSFISSVTEASSPEGPAASGLFLAKDFRDQRRRTGEPVSEGTKERLSEDRLAMK